VCALSEEVVASGSNDKTIIIWNCIQGVALRKLNEIQVGSICGLAAISNTYIVTSSFGAAGKLVIYNWKTGEIVKQSIAGNGGFHSLLVINHTTIVQGMGDG
jgi:WD40 repeat protein